MRLIIRMIRTAITGLIALWMMWLCFAPGSVTERTALGSDFNQFNLVQMRLAATMLAIAPETTINAYASATDLPPDVIAAHLEAKATGQDLFGPAPSNTPAITSDAAPAPTPARRTEAGGALFVRPD